MKAPAGHWQHASRADTSSEPRPSRITFIWSRGKRGLWAMRTPWATLTAGGEAKAYFHFYAWYQSYLEHLEPEPDSVYFFLALRDRVPIAIIPLRHAKYTRYGIVLNAWESITRPHVPFADIVCAHGAPADGILDALAAFLDRMPVPWDLIAYRHVPEYADMPRLVASMRLPRIAQITKPVHVLELRRTYDELQATFGRNFQKNLRKARKRLVAAGAIEVERVRDAAALPEAFDRFLRLEAAGWKGEQGTRTAIACDPALVGFYRALIATYGPSGRCEVNLLTVNGEDAAAQFCLTFDRTYAILKIGYNEGLSRLAPGNMLLESLLQRLTQEGRYARVDLSSDARWHLDWSPASYCVADYLIFNPSARGRVLFLARTIKHVSAPLLAKARQALGDGTRRAVGTMHAAIKRVRAASVGAVFRRRRRPDPPE